MPFCFRTVGLEKNHQLTVIKQRSKSKPTVLFCFLFRFDRIVDSGVSMLCIVINDFVCLALSYKKSSPEHIIKNYIILFFRFGSTTYFDVSRNS
jgi:hypothetical protein